MEKDYLLPTLRLSDIPLSKNLVYLNNALSNNPEYQNYSLQEIINNDSYYASVLKDMGVYYTKYLEYIRLPEDNTLEDTLNRVRATHQHRCDEANNQHFVGQVLQALHEEVENGTEIVPELCIPEDELFESMNEGIRLHDPKKFAQLLKEIVKVSTMGNIRSGNERVVAKRLLRTYTFEDER